MDNETLQIIWNLKYVIAFTVVVWAFGLYVVGKDEQ